MTTYNHTLLATSVAIVSKEWSLPEKLVALAALAFSHLVFDAIPHLHWYSFVGLSKNPKQLLGAFVELFGGLIILPVVFVIVFGLDWFWLGAFVISASAFDFMVASKVSLIISINHRAHFWADKVKGIQLAVWEIGQTAIMVYLVWFCLFQIKTA